MMRLLLPVILVGILGHTPAPAGDTSLVRLPAFSCPGTDADACYQEAARALAQSADDQDKILGRDGSALPKVRKQDLITPLGKRSEYSLRGARTPIAFVVIHGLYAGPGQFDRQTQYLSELGMNSISLALAGHGDEISQGKKVHYEDWLVETKRAVALARALGEKVVIIGQSTGGMLAVSQALSDPKSVDGLVLLEPSVEVRPLLSLGLCFGRFFGDTPQEVPTITRLVGRDPCTEPPVSFAMGCQVTRLRDHLIQEHLGGTGPFHSDGPRPSPDQLSTELGELLRVPVMLLNNPDDDVVRAQANEALFKGISKTDPSAQRLNLPPNTTHGALTWENPKLVETAIESFLSQRMGMKSRIENSREARGERAAIRESSSILEDFVQTEAGKALLRGELPAENAKIMSAWLKKYHQEKLDRSCSEKNSERPDCAALLEVLSQPSRGSALKIVQESKGTLSSAVRELYRQLKSSP